MLIVLHIVQLNQQYTFVMPFLSIKDHKLTLQTVNKPTNRLHGEIVFRHILADLLTPPQFSSFALKSGKTQNNFLTIAVTSCEQNNMIMVAF